MPIKFPTTLKLTTTITRELNLELSANDIFELGKDSVDHDLSEEIRAYFSANEEKVKETVKTYSHTISFNNC